MPSRGNSLLSAIFFLPILLYSFYLSTNQIRFDSQIENCRSADRIESRTDSEKIGYSLCITFIAEKDAVDNEEQRYSRVRIGAAVTRRFRRIEGHPVRTFYKRTNIKPGTNSFNQLHLRI